MPAALRPGAFMSTADKRAHRYLTMNVSSAMVSALSWLLRFLPDHVPGKTRIGRWLLRPFLRIRPALLRDWKRCNYVLPSYAEPIAQHLFTFGAYERATSNSSLALFQKAEL